MEKLKALFGTEALTFEQFEEKLKDNKEIKLANLASGEYVDKKKFDDKVSELTTANDTIRGLKDTVSKFDGVDVEKLKGDVKGWEDKYNKDIADVKLNSAVELELIKSKVKNPKLAKGALDLSLCKMDGENLLGLSEQITKLKESDAYLFEEETDPNKGGARMDTGGAHGGSGNTDAFMSTFRKYAGLEN